MTVKNAVEVSNGLSLLYLSHISNLSLHKSYGNVFTIKDSTAKHHGMHLQSLALGSEKTGGQGVEEQ